MDHVATPSHASASTQGPARRRRRAHVVLTVLLTTVLGTVAAPALAATTTAQTAPVGFLDSATGDAGMVHVVGWALDQDTPATPATVRVSVAGEVHTFTAAQYRPDVAAAYPGTGTTHGFDVWLKTAKTGAQTVQAWAMEGTTAYPIGTKTVTISPATGNPIGGVYFAAGYPAGLIRVTGWAIDPDAPTTGVTVHVYVDGPAGTGTFLGSAVASSTSSLLGLQYPWAGSNHLLSVPLPTTLKGSHTIYAYAINVGAGTTNTFLGSRTAVINPRSYVPLKPARILDTRNGVGAPKAAVGAGRTVTFPTAGRGGLPSTPVDGVVLNLTAVPSGKGYATAYAKGLPRPGISNINYVAGRTIANQAVVRGDTGGVTLYASGTSHFVADVVGYFPSGSPMTTASPERLLDTRLRGTKLGAGSSTVVQTGTDDQLAMNVTAVAPEGTGYVTQWVTEWDRPTTSVLNYTSGQTVAAMNVAEPYFDSFSYYTSRKTHLIVDTMADLGDQDDWICDNPARLLDTRKRGYPVPAGGTVKVTIPQEEVRRAHTAALTITAVSPSGTGWLTVYPTGTTRPTASSLNFVTGQTIANSAVAKVGSDGTVTIYASKATHILVDYNGEWW